MNASSHPSVPVLASSVARAARLGSPCLLSSACGPRSSFTAGARSSAARYRAAPLLLEKPSPTSVAEARRPSASDPPGENGISSEVPSYDELRLEEVASSGDDISNRSLGAVTGVLAGGGVEGAVLGVSKTVLAKSGLIGVEGDRSDAPRGRVARTGVVGERGGT